MLKRNAEDIAEGQWEAILKAAGLDPLYLTYKEGPCPVCGGSQRFRWRAKTEDGFCNGCRRVGGFAILQHLLKTDFRGACDHIRTQAGCGADQQSRPVIPLVAVKKPAPVEDDTNKLREKYKKLWSESLPIDETFAAHAYLLKRIPGLKQIPRVLRAQHSLAYWTVNDGGVFERLGDFPAMLAVAQGVDGHCVNIWRTYLTADGIKADLPDAKKAAGRFLQDSFAVRLYEPDDELAVAEGIETALAVTALYGIPCWASLNAGGMKKFVLPNGYERVKKVRFFADNDARDQNGRRAGNDAAQFAKEQMRLKGLTSTVILPKFTNFDFADIARKK